MTLAADPGRGFTAPVEDAQQVFRAALDALAHPGRIASVATRTARPPLSVAATALLLALADHETPVWLAGATAGVADYLRFHASAPAAPGPDAAAFAVVADAADLPPLDRLALGTDEFPDRSATLILEVGALGEGQPLRLSGPGIAGAATLAVAGLPPRFLTDWAANRRRFPRGIDCFLTAGERLVGLARTTVVEG